MLLSSFRRKSPCGGLRISRLTVLVSFGMMCYVIYQNTYQYVETDTEAMSRMEDDLNIRNLKHLDNEVDNEDVHKLSQEDESLAELEEAKLDELTKESSTNRVRQTTTTPRQEKFVQQVPLPPPPPPPPEQQPQEQQQQQQQQQQLQEKETQTKRPALNLTEAMLKYRESLILKGATAHESCIPLEEDNWQEVKANHTYVYATHLMNHTTKYHHEFRMIGAMEVNALDAYKLNVLGNRLFCKIYFWSDNMQLYLSMSAAVSKITKIYYKHAVTGFVDVVFHCTIVTLKERVPHGKIALIHESIENRVPSPNCMRVRCNIYEPLKYDFSVCAGAAFDKSMPVPQFIEWMEMNRLLGAKKVILHVLNNTKGSKEYDDVFNYYKDIDYLEALPWGNTPAMENSSDIVNLFQQSIFNDCFFRMRLHSKYIVQLQTNEFLIPRYQTHWHDMVAKSTELCGLDVNTINEYGAKCHTFLLNNGTEAPITQRNFQRSAQIFPFFTESRYITVTSRSYAMKRYYSHPQNLTESVRCIIKQGGIYRYVDSLPMHYAEEYINLTHIITDNNMERFGTKLRDNMENMKAFVRLDS